MCLSWPPISSTMNEMEVDTAAFILVDYKK